MDEQSQTPESHGAPPQEGGGLYVDRDPIDEEWVEAAGWPKVIGIISIVWGGLLIACVGCGLGAQLIFAPMQAQMFTDGMPPAATNPPLLVYVSAILGSIINVFLIIAGSLLLMRRPVARTMHLVYVVVALASAALGIYAQLQMQAEITDWVQQNPDTQYAQQIGANAIGQVVGIVAGMLFGFAWPIFCLIWFGAVKRDSSEITRGVEHVV